MERKIVFVPGEYYHLFSRGTEKRKIFLQKTDYERFVALLYVLNQSKTFQLSQFMKRGKKKVSDVYNIEIRGPLVSILAYSLMPNHFHLLISEHIEGGITKFMSKLLTAYSMYFNTKYERSGSLFVHTFRSVHVQDDIHFKHLFSYIHLNCLDLFQYNWAENGISDLVAANNFLIKYNYSSYSDFLPEGTRMESKILDIEKTRYFLEKPALNIKEYELWNSSSRG